MNTLPNEEFFFQRVTNFSLARLNSLACCTRRILISHFMIERYYTEGRFIADKARTARSMLRNET